MGFGDLASDKGLKALDDFLLSRSYIEGFKPSKADEVVYNHIKSAPNTKYVNVTRWMNHIKALGGKFEGVAKSIEKYGQSGADSKKPAADDDSDDLFGSEDEESTAARQKLLAQYKEKKGKKPALIAKSSILLDVKPLDDETDMIALEKKIREIKADGLLWGQGKLVPVAFGIKKLVIGCVVEDDKIGTDFLEESIGAIDDMVQSVDIAAFNKI